MNFAHMYTSAKLAKQGLIIQNMILTAREAVLCYTRARAVCLRLHLLRNSYQAGPYTLKIDL